MYLVKLILVESATTDSIITDSCSSFWYGVDLGFFYIHNHIVCEYIFLCPCTVCMLLFLSLALLHLQGRYTVWKSGSEKRHSWLVYELRESIQLSPWNQVNFCVSIEMIIWFSHSLNMMHLID